MISRRWFLKALISLPFAGWLGREVNAESLAGPTKDGKHIIDVIPVVEYYEVRPWYPDNAAQLDAQLVELNRQAITWYKDYGRYAITPNEVRALRGCKPIVMSPGDKLMRSNNGSD